MPSFDFARDVLPDEFKGLLEKERRVINVDAADVGLVKDVIEMVAQQQRKDNGTGTLAV